jgi:Uma2 family endonuclease
MITEPVTIQHLWTDDELLDLPENKFWKLVDGELIKMSPAGAEHGEICSRLLVTVGMHVRTRRLGKVYDSSTGFRLNERNCFAADVAFVRKERLAALLPDPRKFVQGAPDFAIEVLSPSNTFREITRKIQLLLEHGTELIWFVLPRHRQVRVYPGSLEYVALGEEGVLDAQKVLPGLTIPVREVFADPIFED